jgi:large conductance mechanosensitive channel
MSFFKEFKEFAMKGNVMDLAIGVIIGGAFGKIVTSLVNDIITPILSLFTGNIKMNEQVIRLGKSVNGKELEITYGAFIANVIDFLIIALVIFIFVKQLNRLRPKPVPAAPTTKECPHCRSTIHIEATRCPNCTSELK